MLYSGGFMEREKITTGIGSLPYKNICQAVNHSLKYDIPFLPELPNLGDNMLDSVDKGREPSCLKEFKERVIKRNIETVKIQVVGPATFLDSRYGKYKNIEDASDATVNKICDQLYKITHGLETKEIILFLDEPVLASKSFDFQKLWEPIFKSFKVTPGVHCCANMDWDILFKSPLIKYISFDASCYDVTMYPHYRNDKKIGWGIENKGDVRDFKKGDLIHLPCGMSPWKYKAKDCESKLRMLQHVRNKLAKA
jgi:hypothetical protein